jgi:hypothetical protein
MSVSQKAAMLSAPISGVSKDGSLERADASRFMISAARTSTASCAKASRFVSKSDAVREDT